MTDWPNLMDELDAWAAAGRVATLWWRDDDAVEPTPALERLLGLTAAQHVPVCLAVIPARATDGLARRLAAARPPVTPVQHGFAHRNHAPTAEKKAELGADRPAAAVLEELARGQARMTALFGTEYMAVLVPPWNRIAAELIPALPGLGFTGLSTYRRRAAAQAAPGLTQVNSHVDIMRWEAPRGFLGQAEALDLLIGELQARRRGEVGAGEPTGLLTHHLAHDEACWAFLESLLGVLAEHPAVRFAAVGEIFPAPGAARQTRGMA
ncbi:MAG: polysaccharide deacetylase family protein [Kiloniellaceae bacterium]